jgi:FMN phosphatase YigB (HAD superfamily)
MTKVLLFDIGGTVFDWNTAILEALERVCPEASTSQLDRPAFATACRAGFLNLNGAVARVERAWLTADQPPPPNDELSGQTFRQRHVMRLSPTGPPAVLPALSSVGAYAEN